MKRTTARIGRFLKRPQVTVCLGILVFLSGLSEILEEIFESYEGTIQAVHGVMVFGIMTVLKGLTELAEGFELVTIEIEESKREDAEDAENNVRGAV